MTESGEFNADSFREQYMKFMQKPGSHTDTYAATAHRMFFKNLVVGTDPKLCPDNDGHNVDAIDALTTAIPVIIQYADSEPQLRNQKVMEAIRVIRNVKSVESYAIHLSDLLVEVLNGKDLKEST
jgi:hypothetical protein